jgi:hypothetical protein
MPSVGRIVGGILSMPEPVEPKKVAQILSMIGELYAIEGQIREKSSTGGK